MMPYGWHDGAWGYVMMIGSWTLFVLLIYMVVRSITAGERRDRTPRGDEALQTLDQRFASGEMTEQEYRDRRKILEESR